MTVIPTKEVRHAAHAMTTPYAEANSCNSTFLRTLDRYEGATSAEVRSQAARDVRRLSSRIHRRAAGTAVAATPIGLGAGSAAGAANGLLSCSLALCTGSLSIRQAEGDKEDVERFIEELEGWEETLRRKRSSEFTSWVLR